MRLNIKKTIVLTGHRGFIGSHLCEYLLAQGHRVIGIDKLTYAANDMTFQGDFKEIIADICDLTDIPACDVLINCCAESHVSNSISGNHVFLRSNVIGVHNLLEIIRLKKMNAMMHSWSYKAPLFVQISTDECFGDITDGFFKPDDRHKPSNPYAATKSAAEQLVTAWGRTYDMPYLITRSTNNYGPRQHTEKLIPNVISRLKSGQKAVVHGAGLYIRNWVHVLDNVEAICTIIDKGELGHAYHIASDEEFPVAQIVQKVCDILGRDYANSVDASSDRSGADVRYALNIDDTLALGWRQHRHFDQELGNLVL